MEVHVGLPIQYILSADLLQLPAAFIWKLGWGHFMSCT